MSWYQLWFFCCTTDHSIMSLCVKPQNKELHSNKYWKFNSSLLENKDYCQKMKSLIIDILNSEELTTKWEFLEYKVHQLSISFSKHDQKELQSKELDTLTQLQSYCNKPDPSAEDGQKRLSLQPKWDEMYTQRAQGVFIRSRAKWRKGRRTRHTSVLLKKEGRLETESNL